MADSWQTIEQAAVSLGLSVRTVNRHIVAAKLQSRLTAEGRREVFVSLPDMPGGESLAPSHFDAAVSGAANAVTEAWHGTADTLANSSTAASIGAETFPAPGSQSFGDPTRLPEPATATAFSSSPFSQAPSPAVTVDPETVLALADNAAEKAEMAIAAYQALARVSDQQAQQVRRNARFAWAAVALMATGVTGAVGYTSYKWTRMSVEADTRLTRASADIEHLQSAVDAGTRVIGQLSADRETLRTELTAKQETLRTELAAARDERARAEGKLAAYQEQEGARQTREASAAAAVAKAVVAAIPPTTQPVQPILAAAAVPPAPVAVQTPAPVSAKATLPQKPAHTASDVSVKPESHDAHDSTEAADTATPAAWKVTSRDFRAIESTVPGLTPLQPKPASNDGPLNLNAETATTEPSLAALANKVIPTTVPSTGPSDNSSASANNEEQSR